METSDNEIVVVDACVLFDLIDLGVLSQFYLLPITVFSTAQVLAEVRDPDQNSQIQVCIEKNQLNVDDSGTLSEIWQIMDLNSGLSYADASMVELTRRRQAVVITTDKRLRNCLNQRGCTVRGSLWILENLYIAELINIDKLHEILVLYKSSNMRAPIVEIDDLLKRYINK